MTSSTFDLALRIRDIYKMILNRQTEYIQHYVHTTIADVHHNRFGVMDPQVYSQMIDMLYACSRFLFLQQYNRAHDVVRDMHYLVINETL